MTKYKDIVWQVNIEWQKRNRFDILPWKKSPLRAFPGPIVSTDNIPRKRLIHERTIKTGRHGALKLWEGYNEPEAKRSPSMVASHAVIAAFYTHLVMAMRPQVVVEFGSAFGISGMHWLAGLEKNQEGHLYTYEVNEEWAALAEENLSAIGSRFTLTKGLFEENVDRTLDGKKIDLAFIDGIHTSEWVKPQYELVVQRLRRRGIIILDDITFSEDMKACWDELSQEDRVLNAATINGRVGLIQLR